MFADLEQIANTSYYHYAPVLWNSLFDLRHVAHHVTSNSPILNSPVSNLLTSLFLNKCNTRGINSDCRLLLSSTAKPS